MTLLRPRVSTQFPSHSVTIARNRVGAPAHRRGTPQIGRGIRWYANCITPLTLPTSFLDSSHRAPYFSYRLAPAAARRVRDRARQLLHQAGVDRAGTSGNDPPRAAGRSTDARACRVGRIPVD